MKKQRPVNLDLTTISLPASAKASILHRVTGVAMFIALILVVWAWAVSLSSAEGFELVKSVLTSHFAKFLAWGTITVLLYHVIGGIRHMLMDLGYWEELSSGNTSARVAIGLWILLAVLAGGWLWF
ncbi:succinate dehydrogenase, cytochrome b556 subunit [Alkalimonas sp. MEB108]|uniref:Succinate dehydrogenase cytochrome b556 subunit n=1 Tax=Alkalimonas cellulosilytica TaxID=3058395 RepID=A0ABU7J4L8_9GAMM|nr:succinate dehydrogenase, cytochrome b556 subunit [Alkalimonas sp. MEB108]MEE2001453.1 succinate dehydrogenase, cytochrome b556 subunit [Alkalimonas sp. MEB108]